MFSVVLSFGPIPSSCKEAQTEVSSKEAQTEVSSESDSLFISVIRVGVDGEFRGSWTWLRPLTAVGQVRDMGFIFFIRN